MTSTTGITLEEFEKQVDAKCQHCYTLRQSDRCSKCNKLLCQHCIHYFFCGQAERGDIYHKSTRGALSVSVNRGGGQAKMKAVEKDDGKYDRDDVETGPVRQKKGANKINISLMMKCSRSQASTRLINDEFDGAEASLSRNSEQERTLMLAKKHVSNDTECASGETPSPPTYRPCITHAAAAQFNYSSGV